jgi:type II secretory pathway pseudopilin PulG
VKLRPPLARWRRQRGFGILEVLVAFVLFSGVGVILLGWLQQNLATTQRLRGVYLEAHARQLALDVARSVNVMQFPSGNRQIGDLTVRWQAEPLGDETVQTGYPLGVGRHTLRLYTTTLKVFKGEDALPWITESVVLVGSRLTVPVRAIN